MHLISYRVASARRTDADGNRVYTNRDVLANADLVTYLPIWEGFGNALLEAVAAKVPVVTTTYLVYKTDIMITGMRAIEIRDRYGDDGLLAIPDSALEAIDHILTNREARREMVETSFAVAQREFGMNVLREKLDALLAKAKQRYSV